MTLSISNTVVTCYSEPNQFLSSSQLALSRSLQEFCQESISCSAILGLALGRTLGILAKSQSFHLFSSWGNAQSRLGLSRFGSAAIGFAFEGASFHSISTWGATGTFQIGAWNENLHSALTLALCHGIGRKFSTAGIPIQHLMQNGGMVALDLSLECFQIIERSHQGVVERFCNAEIMSFRMEISAKFLATTCPQVSYIQAKMEIQTKVSERRIEKRERGTESFGQEFATINGASAEGLREYLKTKAEKKENLHFSEKDKTNSSAANLGIEKTTGEAELIEYPENLFTELPPWLAQFHRQIDRFLKRRSELSRDEQTAFRLLAEYTVWIRKGEYNNTTLPSLFASFPQFRDYFVTLTRFSEDILEYHQKTSMVITFPYPSLGRYLFYRVLALYLARRDSIRNSEILLDSIRKSVMELLHSDCHEDGITFVKYHRMCIDFLTRRIADDEVFMSQNRDRIQKHFPLASYYQSGKTNGVTQLEVEQIIDDHLRSIEKPNIVIPGVGAEWDQIKRFAQKQSCHIVLVDPNDGVNKFFKEKEEEIRRLETTHDVTIEYWHEKMTSDKFIRHYAGRIDYIELQNTIGLSSSETSEVNRLLKPGGLIVQFSPYPITKPESEFEKAYQWSQYYTTDYFSSQFNYRIFLDKKNIPSTLKTMSETLAYPLGNHLLIIQKPQKT